MRCTQLFFVFFLLRLTGCSTDSGDSIEATGTIEGTNVNLAAEVTGQMERVLVDEGSRVRKGDTLLVIDNEDYLLNVRRSNANAEAAEAQYRLALEGARKEDILQAEAAFKTADADHARMKELLALRTVTQKEYDDAYARYVAAQQTYEKLLSGLRQNEIVAAKARRDQAVAEAELSRKKLRDCIVTAPCDGVVTLKAVEVGELVSPGSRVIRLTNLDRVDLMIYVSEVDLGKILLGQKAEITIDSYPERVFPGSVVYISPVAEFTPKNVQTREERTKLVFGVKIQVENSDGVLKPGLPADAKLPVNAGS